MYKINGANLKSEASVLYDTLAESDIVRQLNLSKEEIDILKQIDAGFKMLMNVHPSNIRKMPIRNGKADISEGYFFHSIPITSTSESIELRCKYGILPSERFGILESGQEMRFCVGVCEGNDFEEGCKTKPRKIRNDDGTRNQYNVTDITMSIIGGLNFIISPDIKYYFKNCEFLSYVRNPSELINEQDRKILDFVKRCSPKADQIVNGSYCDSYNIFNWRGLIGGIPPQFIVGVCINVTDEECCYKPEEYKEIALNTARRCAELINCPLLDHTGQVIYNPPLGVNEQKSPQNLKKSAHDV